MHQIYLMFTLEDKFQLQVEITIELLFLIKMRQCWDFQQGHHLIDPYNRLSVCSDNNSIGCSETYKDIYLVVNSFISLYSRGS